MTWDSVPPWIAVLVQIVSLVWVIRRQGHVLDKVEEVHIATNSMKDTLVAVTEAEALARGKLEGAAVATAAIVEAVASPPQTSVPGGAS